MGSACNHHQPVDAFDDAGATSTQADALLRTAASTKSQTYEPDGDSALPTPKAQSRSNGVVIPPLPADPPSNGAAGERPAAAEDDPAAKPDVEALLSLLDKKKIEINCSGSLNSYSLLASVPLEQKREAERVARRSVLLDRAMGAVCGMAVADAIGHMFEFLPAVDRRSESHFDLETLKFHNVLNRFKLQYGQWTDDAAMGLCMADSLIVTQGYDGSDMRIRFWCWWNRGYNNAFRLDHSRERSVGLGGNISKSLAAMSRLRPGDTPPPVYGAETEDSGNGSLMRLAPVPLFFHAAPLTELHDVARQSSYTTHPGIIAAEACALFSHLISRALSRPHEEPDAKQFIDTYTAEYIEMSGLLQKKGRGYDEVRWMATGQPTRPTERCWRWREESLEIVGSLHARGSSYNGYPVSDAYFGSYSLDGLAIALWSVYHTSSFDTAVTQSINVLGDADSHGSITGQLAGALYGHSQIHPQFLAWINKWDEHEIAVRGILLCELGARFSAAPAGAK